MYLKFYEITTSDKGPFKIALLNLKTRIQACTSSVLINRIFFVLRFGVDTDFSDPI